MLRNTSHGSLPSLKRSKSAGPKFVPGSDLNKTANGLGGSERGRSARESLSAWHRYDVPVTDVYDVVDILGEGHMGEVYKVQRKVEDRGAHNSATRAKTDQRHPSFAEDNAAPPSPIVRRTSKLLKNSKIMKKISKHKHKKEKEKETDHEMRQLVDQKNKSLPKEPPTNVEATPKSILKKPKVIVLKESTSTPDLPSQSTTSSDSARKDGGTGDPQSPLRPKLEKQCSLEESFGGSEFCDASSVSSSSSSTVNSREHHGDVIIGLDLDNLDQDHEDKQHDTAPAKRKIRFQRLFACKTVFTTRVKKDQMDDLMNEIYIMRTLDHPYILPLYEVYEVKRKIWLITELCTGGDLTSRKLTEPEATVVLEQILYAIAYMHNRNICHRDIKLENIMYENTRKDASIRLIDFGLSQTFDRATVKRDFVRSAYTLSPEMAAGGKHVEYTAKTDMWCIGIVAWILLAGDPPFLKDPADLKDKNKMDRLINARYQYGITWSGRGITQHGKDFVKGLLKKNPDDRWTAKEALHFVRETWIPAIEEKSDKEKKVKDAEYKVYQEFKEKREKERRDLEERARKHKSEKEGIETEAKTETKESSGILSPGKGQKYDGPLAKKPTSAVHRSISEQRKNSLSTKDITVEDLNRYCNYGMMKKTALLTMAHTMDRGDVGKLREIFMMADIEDTGTINLMELKAAFKSFKLDVDADDETIERIFKGIDHDKSGQIHYAEFLAALVEGQGLITMERLADAFDRIDAGGKGYISHNDLKELLGSDYDRNTVNRMIEEADFKKNGQVDYEEFLQLMFEDPGKGVDILGDDGSSALRRMSNSSGDRKISFP